MAYDERDLNLQVSDAPDDNTNRDSGDVLDPAKKLGILDKTLDSAFEQLLSSMNTQDDTLLNNIQSINLKSLASFGQTKKNSGSIQDEVKERIGGLDDSILSQFENLSIPKERLERYKQYSQLPYELYIATRMIQVYLDNILIKNPYTKQFIDILYSEMLEQDNSIADTDKQVLLKLVKMIFAYFDIQKRLKNDILPKQLVLGNFFIEIVNLNKFADIEKRNDSFQILTEQYTEFKNSKIEYNSHKLGFGIKFDLSNIYYESLMEEMRLPVSDTELDFDRQIQYIMESKSADVSYESQLLFEEINENISVDQIIESIRSLDLAKIKYINLEYISPENVIILEKNGNKYGYLVIEGQDKKTENSNNGAETYNILNSVQKSFGNGSNSNTGANDKDTVSAQLDSILKHIFKKIRDKHNITKINELLGIISNENTSHALKSLLYDMYKNYAKVNIRYVPADEMINFTNPIDKYAPYGTSIFDTVLFPARLYLIGLLSSIISRMNRASVVRKWTIEAGSHRNHAEIIEKFKRELKNQTISFEDIAKLRDVSQMVSDYKDFVTISQDGKRFVDLEIMPMHDRSLPMNELDTLKADLISASGIPSPMLGITDTYDLREQIVNVNIIFATKIDTFQTFINESLEELVNAVTKQLYILNGKEPQFNTLSKYVDIKLNPPLVLVLQHLESTLSSATNIINLLNSVNLPTDPVWVLKRFIKIIDWDAVRHAGSKYQKKIQAEQAIQQEIQQAMMPQEQGSGF